MLKEKTKLIYADKMVVRTSKNDSAFLYHLLESHEGLTAYSTLDFFPGDLYRDVELLVSPDQKADLKTFLAEVAEFVTVLTE